VSRSNLNSSTIHNTTGTFNLVVKDRFAFRLSGAFQSKLQPAYWPVAVLETYSTYRVPSRAVNPCIFCVLHRNPTAFRCRLSGSAAVFRRRDKTLSGFTDSNSKGNTEPREFSKLQKIFLEVRDYQDRLNPSRTLSPNRTLQDGANLAVKGFDSQNHRWIHYLSSFTAHTAA
jgi:hypothetical protein